MPKIKKHIEIVYSTSKGLSSMGPKTALAIKNILKSDYTNVGITIVNGSHDLSMLAASQPDLVFLGMKFIPENPELGIADANKVWLSQYFESQGILTTGSAKAAHELEFNKALAKQRVIDGGLATSPFYVIPSNFTEIDRNLPFDYPVFIKPTNLGGGRGIDSNSLANSYDELLSKVLSLATSLFADSLIEKYLAGREFSVAILKVEHTEMYDVMPLELIAPLNDKGARILTAKIKSADAETFAAVTDVNLRDCVSTLAVNTFHALGARDFGRIDIRLDEFGVPHFLEANLIPSLMNGYGNFPKACWLNLGLSYTEMIHRIVRLGLARSAVEELEIVPALYSFVAAAAV
ncbi:hypothetical protein BH10PAT3_BH10PAT3_6700 [soil metagenome]